MGDCTIQNHAEALAVYDKDHDDEELRATIGYLDRLNRNEDSYSAVHEAIDAAWLAKPETKNLRADFFGGLGKTCHEIASIWALKMGWGGKTGTYYVADIKNYTEILAIAMFHNLDDNKRKELSLKVSIKNASQSNFQFLDEYKGRALNFGGPTFTRIKLEKKHLEANFSIRLEYFYNGKSIKIAQFDYEQLSVKDKDGCPVWKTDPAEKGMEQK